MAFVTGLNHTQVIAHLNALGVAHAVDLTLDADINGESRQPMPYGTVVVSVTLSDSAGDLYMVKVVPPPAAPAGGAPATPTVARHRIHPDYPFIRAYCQMIESSADWTNREVERARDANAPQTAVTMRNDGSWSTLAAFISSPDVLRRLLALAERCL